MRSEALASLRMGPATEDENAAAAMPNMATKRTRPPMVNLLIRLIRSSSVWYLSSPYFMASDSSIERYPST